MCNGKDVAGHAWNGILYKNSEPLENRQVPVLKVLVHDLYLAMDRRG